MDQQQSLTTWNAEGQGDNKACCLCYLDSFRTFMEQVTNLLDDLKSGVILYHLLEEISGENLSELDGIGKLSKVVSVSCRPLCQPAWLTPLRVCQQQPLATGEFSKPPVEQRHPQPAVPQVSRRGFNQHWRF
jgi:hypothetical protein